MEKFCSVKGCVRAIQARGYCFPHLRKWYKYGDPLAGTTHVQHGDHRAPEYLAWLAMKSRCMNSNNGAYKHYGGRGITVCERWSKYLNFLSDMGRRPSDAHELERINNDGNYEPGNCRWATRAEQMRNTRRNRLVNVRGKIMPLVDAAELLGITWDMARYRVRKGRSLEGQKGKHAN